MDFRIRPAVKEDCTELLNLVRQLAIFEKAPDAVTVSLEDFIAHGFCENPVWWAFVAVTSEGKNGRTSNVFWESDSMNTGSVLNEPFDCKTNLDEPEVLNSATGQLPDGPELSRKPLKIETEIPGPCLPSLHLESTEEPREKILGFALYYLRFSTWKGLRMYLEDIYVRDEVRGVGIGTALMDALFGRAKSEGISGIVWQVLDWNEAAINFYKRYNPSFDKSWINVTVEM